MADAVVVHGLRDLNRAFRNAERSARLGLRAQERQIAEPVRSDAEAFAGSRIANIGDQWPKMRTGVTQSAVYVAPRQKGVRGRGPRSRPNLANLLMNRAMEPALERNRARVERDVDRVIDGVGAVWEHT